MSAIQPGHSASEKPCDHHFSVLTDHASTGRARDSESIDTGNLEAVDTVSGHGSASSTRFLWVQLLALAGRDDEKLLL